MMVRPPEFEGGLEPAPEGTRVLVLVREGRNGLSTGKVVPVCLQTFWRLSALLQEHCWWWPCWSHRACSLTCSSSHHIPAPQDTDCRQCSYFIFKVQSQSFVIGLDFPPSPSPQARLLPSQGRLLSSEPLWQSRGG